MVVWRLDRLGRCLRHLIDTVKDIEDKGAGFVSIQEGIDTTRARGRVGGRKEKLTLKQIKTLQKMYDSRKHTISEMGWTFGISRPTVYRYLKQMQ